MFHFKVVFSAFQEQIPMIVGFPSQPCFTGDLLEAYLEVSPQPRTPTKMQPEDRLGITDAVPNMPGVSRSPQNYGLKQKYPEDPCWHIDQK